MTDEAAATADQATATTNAVPRLAPDWLVRTEVGLCPCGCIGRRRKGNVVAKTLQGGADLVRRAVFSDDAAARAGLLQRVDARVKVVTLVGLLVVAAFVRTIPVLTGMYVAAVLVAVASGLSVRFFLTRVWLFVPVFTGIVVLPATLNLITPGRIVVPLGTWFGGEVGLTAEGLESAGLMVMRVALSISLVVLLTVTTRWSRLLAALRSLFVPATVVLVLAMAYRYLFHLLTSVTDMYTARRARTVGTDTDVRSSRRFVAASAGALFGKSHALSEEVYLAMVARGYRGETRLLQPTRLRVTDVLWCAACLAAAVLVLWGDGVVG
jgi:cobalt/nickel transport system permease protein